RWHAVLQWGLFVRKLSSVAVRRRFSRAIRCVVVVGSRVLRLSVLVLWRLPQQLLVLWLRLWLCWVDRRCGAAAAGSTRLLPWCSRRSHRAANALRNCSFRKQARSNRGWENQPSASEQVGAGLVKKAEVDKQTGSVGVQIRRAAGFFL